MLKSLSGIMRFTTAYRLWQAPFARAKLEPVLRHARWSSQSRILDVGCGPGTNSLVFQDCDYTGVDINADYIDYAKRRFYKRFLVQDVSCWDVPADERFDLVLMNSLLHHLDDASTTRLLQQVSTLLKPEGSVHVIDLVLPETPSLARWFARNDRGDFPRKLERWRELFEAAYEPIAWEPFPIRALGVSCWQLIYFQGRTKR
jgi:SAM-dependent methyltransferase